MTGTSILNPKVTLNIIPGATLSTVQDRRVLIVGQKLDGGTTVSGALTESINALTNTEVNTLFGQSSVVAGMIRSMQRTLSGITPQPQIDVIALDDNGGAVAATAVITIVGTATENGEIIFTVGSKTDHNFAIGILDTEDETAIAVRIKDAINADLNAPFTADNTAGVVTITAENGGTVGNTWGISFEGAVAGVTSVTLAAWSGGATDPVLTTVFDPIKDIRETTIIWPEAYDIAVLQTELDSRFNVANSVQDGVGISVRANNTTALKGLVSPLNSESVVVFGNTVIVKVDKAGPGIFELSDVIATEIGVIRALRLTEDAPVTSFINSAGSPNDAFGGIHISSKPYHNTLLPNISVPPPGEYFTQAEQADLTDNGVAVLGANRASNAVILGTVVTTYLTDTAGNPDTAFKFLNTVDQMSIIREFYVNNLQSRYSQSRLTDGAITVGFALENEDSIRGFCVQLYQQLAADVITQSGNVALQAYKDSLSVVVDVSLGKATINQAPLLVGQLRIIVGAIEVNFG